MLGSLKQYRLPLLTAAMAMAVVGLWRSGIHIIAVSGQTAVFRGHLTYLDFDRGILYLQNETTAVRVEAGSVESAMDVGQVVEATGTPASDRSATTLLATRVRILKAGVVPNAVALSGHNLVKSHFDMMRVVL